MFGQWGQGYAGMDAAAQQMYWQQYYAQAQQYYGAYGASMPGMPAAGTTATTATNPVPPAEPPKEDPPPLPVEPPPDEKVDAFDDSIFDFVAKP